MDCNNCIYCNRCKQPNKNNPACLMNARYSRAVIMANVPKMYRKVTLSSLPIKKDNPEAYRKIIKYSKDIDEYILVGMSVYLYSNGDHCETELGTGTGKTTSACAIINNFIAEYIWKITKEGKYMDVLPAYFVKCANFQNMYSIQYKNEDAMLKYQSCKEKMKSCELLVLDDIALRGCSEGFMCELYEVIDHRVSEELPIIYTSNIPREKVDAVLDTRIQSRLYENCIPIEISGIDHRF